MKRKSDRCPDCGIVTGNGNRCGVCRMTHGLGGFQTDSRLADGFAMIDDDIGQDYDCQDGHNDEDYKPFAWHINPLIF